MSQACSGNRVNSQTAHVLPTELSGEALNLAPLLAVSEHKRSGLILCKPYHAEFAGPGAAIGTLIDQECTAIVAIGSPEIIELLTHEDRQQAYGRRIQWTRWLHKITDNPDPILRTEKLFAGFEAFFGSAILSSLSDEVLALLAGVLPPTIAIVRSQYRYSRQLDSFDTGSTDSICKTLDPSVISLSPRIFQSLGGVSPYLQNVVGLPSNRYSLPCLA